MLLLKRLGKHHVSKINQKIGQPYDGAVVLLPPGKNTFILFHWVGEEFGTTRKPLVGIQEAPAFLVS